MTMTTRLAIALALGACLAGAGPAAAEDTALLIGNSNYSAKCITSLPNVPTDVTLMTGHLMNGGYATVAVADRNSVEMYSDIEGNVPPAPDNYVMYYSGHGDPTLPGALLGVNCSRVTAADIVVLVDTASDRTLLILDSEASGKLADDVNAMDPNFCTITSTTGTDSGTPGVFTPCFAAGLDGAADADDNGMVTVAEAAAYAIANCGDGTTTPTWDGGCPD
ncbi:caspase family protein, partial [bacterium]|nr:caspase family protein [bacterium]